jgi:hypothetical protein
MHDFLEFQLNLPWYQHTKKSAWSADDFYRAGKYKRTYATDFYSNLFKEIPAIFFFFSVDSFL